MNISQCSKSAAKLFVLMLAVNFLLCGQLQAKNKKVTLPMFKPTLSGVKNYAFIEMDEVERGNNMLVVFWIPKKGSKYSLTAAAGGGWLWGGSYTVGRHGEHIFSRGLHNAINDETEYVGNFDYEGSTYIFLGDVILKNHVFLSNKKRPLVFKLVKNKGFVYVKGKGSVETPSGKKYKF